STSSGMRSRSCGCRSPLCAAERRRSSTTPTSTRCGAASRTQPSSSWTARGTAFRATNRSSSPRFFGSCSEVTSVLEPLPQAFTPTRDAMHAIAEHVLAPFRYRADGHIGLVVTAGGFGTPTLADGERVRVEGVELVYERPGTATRVGLTTLGIAAQFVDVPLG